MKLSLHAWSAALMLIGVSVSTGATTIPPAEKSTSSPNLVSLLYRNTDDTPVPAATNLNIRPDFRLVNHSDHEIWYSNLSVRYWFTQEQRSSMYAEVIFAKFFEENVVVNFHELTEPRQGANFYAQFNFTPEAGKLLPGDTTVAFIRTRFRKSDWTTFSESDDYSYMPPGQTYVNEHMTVYYNGELIWGTEPEVVAPVNDFRLQYSRGSATADTQILMLFRFKNAGNVPVAMSDIKLRYWFSENDDLPLQYIEHYIADDRIHTTGTIVGFAPEREGANHYLEIDFDAPGVVVYPFSDLRNFKFKIIRQGWKKFTNRFDDYSFDNNTNEYLFVENEHITMYKNGELIWGTEPPVLASARMNTHDADAMQDLSLFPLPAKGRATLLASGDVREVGYLRVIDFSGRNRDVGYHVEGNSVVLDLQRLEKGIYFLNVELNRKTYKKRLIVD